MKKLLMLSGIFCLTFALACSDEEGSKEGTPGGSISFKIDGTEYNFNVEFVEVPIAHECEGTNTSYCILKANGFSENYRAEMRFGRFEVGSYECEGVSSEILHIGLREKTSDGGWSQGNLIGSFSSCQLTVTKLDGFKMTELVPGSPKKYGDLTRFEATFSGENTFNGKVLTEGHASFYLEK